MENGVYVVEVNNEYFGLVLCMLMLGCGVNMGDGWEMCCCCELGNDWCVIVLVNLGCICKIEVDIVYFKGNFVDCVFIQVVCVVGGIDSLLKMQVMFW